MRFNSRQFKKLKEEWYVKLKQSGFKDIEFDDGRDGLLEPTRAIPETSHETIKYYKLAATFLEQGNFDSMQHRALWFMHAEGAPGALIAQLLGLSESAVSRIISRYEKVMLKR